jgi:hypothetical protein
VDPRYHARLLEAAAAIPGTWIPVRVPPGDLDGAVIEVQHHDDDTFTGEIRIPGPPAP